MDHRREFKAAIETAIQTDEEHVLRFRQFLTDATKRLEAWPDDVRLQRHIIILEDLIARAEEKIASLRGALKDL